MHLSKPYTQGRMLYDFKCRLKAAEPSCYINRVFRLGHCVTVIWNSICSLAFERKTTTLKIDLDQIAYLGSV